MGNGIYFKQTPLIGGSKSIECITRNYGKMCLGNSGRGFVARHIVVDFMNMFLLSIWIIRPQN